MSFIKQYLRNCSSTGNLGWQHVNTNISWCYSSVAVKQPHVVTLILNVNNSAFGFYLVSDIVFNLDVYNIDGIFKISKYYDELNLTKFVYFLMIWNSYVIVLLRERNSTMVLKFILAYIYISMYYNVMNCLYFSFSKYKITFRKQNLLAIFLLINLCLDWVFCPPTQY